MRQRIWWLIAAAVLLAGVGMMGSQAVLKAVSGPAAGPSDLISVTEGSSSNAALKLDDIDAIESAIDGAKLSWWAVGRGAIGADERNTQAEVYAVSGAFEDFHHMDMLYGSFVPRAEGGMAAVLESDLAYRLFGTENAVGLEVKFMGMTFQVCGVCRSDSSLLGMTSGNGSFRAYVSGDGLISAGKMSIGGFEALVPRGAPGESLQSVTAAMQSQNVSTGSFLIEDKTEQAQLNGEKALIPLILLAVSAMLVLLAFFIRICRGVVRESIAILKDSYFRDVWGALLWRLGKLVLLLGASAGVCWLMWEGVGLKFFLPAKYIPASWIDLTFYTDLIKSESQAAIAAQAYPRQWWDIACSGAVGLSGTFNILALAGCIAAALSLRALRADRRLAAALAPGGKTRGVWDAPVLWLLALLSFCAAMLFDAWIGLPLYSQLGALLTLALALGAWALNMHKEELEKFFFKKRACEVVNVEVRE